MGYELTDVDLILRTHNLCEIDRGVICAEQMVKQMPNSDYWQLRLADYREAQELAEYAFKNGIELLPSFPTKQDKEAERLSTIENQHRLDDEITEVKNNIAGLKKMAHSHRDKKKVYNKYIL